MSVLTDPSTYPVSTATRQQLDRPLFGHVIDGEVVASLDGATMPVVESSTMCQAVNRKTTRVDEKVMRAAAGGRQMPY